MSTKIAVIAGDYSNGWSDAWIYQQPTSVKSLADLSNNREFVSSIMQKHLLEIVALLEKDPKICPAKLEEKCCDDFNEWFSLDQQSAAFCGKCGTKITEERRVAFKKTY